MFGLTLAVTFFLKFRETLMTDFCDIFCAGFTQKDQTLAKLALKFVYFLGYFENTTF